MCLHGLCASVLLFVTSVCDACPLPWLLLLTLALLEGSMHLPLEYVRLLNELNAHQRCGGLCDLCPKWHISCMQWCSLRRAPMSCLIIGSVKQCDCKRSNGGALQPSEVDFKGLIHKHAAANRRAVGRCLDHFGYCGAMPCVYRRPLTGSARP